MSWRVRSPAPAEPWRRARCAPGSPRWSCPPRDPFADPPAPRRPRGCVLADVGGPEPVRGGALADLVDRLEAAGHVVERRPSRSRRGPPRPARSGARAPARFWLWRRRPGRHPLPRPADVGPWPIRSWRSGRCTPTATRPARGRRRARSGRGASAGREVVRPDEVERQRRAEAHAERLHALRRRTARRRRRSDSRDSA